VTRLSVRFSTALVLGFASFCAAAQQPVYRCGNSYSQTPCPQGRMVTATDVRSAAERAEAARIAANERNLAARMRSDRLADESAALAANGRPADLGGHEARQVATASGTKAPKKRAVKLVVKKRPKKTGSAG
jgi:hypothetical protein